MKSLRLMITPECNLSCSYCCNNMTEVKSLFENKYIDDINFDEYKAVCITGGEPLLPQVRTKLSNLLCKLIPKKIPIYLYTNGLLLNTINPYIFDGINIGIHYKSQIKEILTISSAILTMNIIRLCVQDIKREEYLPNIPDRCIKEWKMNDCFNNILTEDWIKLII